MATAESGDMGFQHKELFGGAMSVQLPNNCVDVSDLREVPDNQEVYAHKLTDQSIIVEILERVDKPDKDAIQVHFNDLADTNGASEAGCNKITEIQELPADSVALSQCSGAYYVTGEQQVAKFQETAKNTIAVHMGVFRLPDKQTDIVVSFNDPIAISPESSSHDAGAGADAENQRWTLAAFKRCLHTLKIHDIAFLG